MAERLGSIRTTTDHLLLTRWRVLGLCQYLLGSPDGEAEGLSVEALDAFALDGTSVSTDEALLRAGAAVARMTATGGGSILPSIAPAKRSEVLAQLREHERSGIEAIGRALGALPAIRDRLWQSPAGALLAGIRHRLELLARVAADAGGRSEQDRCRAAATILYVEELHDVIPDTLGHIGLLDDDFALRLVLEEIGGYTEGERLHWTERISALWDDLPFLRGVQLNKAGEPVAITWLDRTNSYVSYLHALNRQRKPLVLLQPSIACSPLHSVVSLIGLLILEGLTSSADRIKSLRKGQVYEIDGRFYARFDGISGPPAPGWLRLQFRDCTDIRPPTLADRLVAVSERRLSSARTFSAHVHSGEAEPIQRFFDWDKAIGAASIPSRVLLVTTRQRAVELFGGINSNGVDLIDDGIVRFSGLSPSADVLQGGLVLVVPNLAVARQLVDQGLDVYAIMVDGYERLHRGRHDLPFLMRRASPPPLITWSSAGYYPTDPPAWLSEHRRLEVSSEDLSYILELDGELADNMAPTCASLWETATGLGVTKVLVNPSDDERQLLDAIEAFLGEISRSPGLPDYWQYHLISSATMLQSLATSTPSCWCDIREIAASWKASFDEQWATLRPRIAEALEPVAKSHRKILEILDGISAERNTKADALLSFLAREADEDWQLVCDRPEQVKLVGRLARRTGASGFEPVLLRDLRVCRACIVVGWRNVSFGRRLWAHTPRRLLALVSDREGQSWDRMARGTREINGESLLEAIGHQPPRHGGRRVAIGAEPTPPEPVRSEKPDVSEGEQSLVPCVFVWLADEPEGRVLARDARILVEVGDQAKEERAHGIRPEDRVILGSRSTRWSPADEFTQAVVDAVEASHPALVREVKEWRRALQRLREARQWSVETLRSKLDEIGVTRGLQTVEGWLRLDQAAPIGPQHIRKELDAIWELVADNYTRSNAADVAEACSRLRSLRAASGRALLSLWKGRAVDVGVKEAWLNELVERLRQEVQVHEVDAVTYGHVPETMLGWWITPDLAAAFEVPETSAVHGDTEEVISEDDWPD